MKNAINRIRARLSTAYAWLGAGATVYVLAPLQDAWSQTMPAPTDVGMEEALGSSTADAETGVYEIRETIEDGWGVIIAIVLTVVGFMLVRKLFRKAGSA